jgi:hypothetical protein
VPKIGCPEAVILLLEHLQTSCASMVLELEGLFLQEIPVEYTDTRIERFRDVEFI